jgi:L-fuconolactonase
VVRVDSHQHFWRYDAGRHAWITPEMSAIRRDFLPGDLAPLLASAGFDGCVAIQADSTEAETDFLLRVAAEHSFIRGVVGWVDLLAPDLKSRLARFRDRPQLRGFRHIAQAEADDFLARDDVARAIATLGDLGYTYDILIYPRQLAAAENLVERCPGTRFVLDHGAKPAIARREMLQWQRGIERLARHPNVACKVSGLATEATWNSWTFTDLEPYFDAIATAFGPTRAMVGSDWPVCLVASEYSRWIDTVNQFAERFSPAERDALFGGTAVDVYGLEAPDGA